MPRLRLRHFVVLFAGLALASRLATAQRAEPRTYTVKRGDTLWDIAKQYLGDAYLWPEIYRLNTATIEDPHWIYPNEVLILPGMGTIASTGDVPSNSFRTANERMTIFNPLSRKVDHQSRESLILGARSTAVRIGDYIASPYAWKVGGPANGGYVELTAEGQGINMTVENRPIQYREPVFIRVPAGLDAKIGTRLLVYRLGTLLEDSAQVLIPTGVVQVTTAIRDGHAQAELMQKFEDVFTGQRVTNLDQPVIPLNVFPARVEFGLATKVVWLYNNPVLATRGQYLVLAAGSRENLVPGDQITLRRDRGLDQKGVALPDEEIATAQITRVTRWGATAIVVNQDQVGIKLGMQARVTAKMP